MLHKLLCPKCPVNPTAKYKFQVVNFELPAELEISNCQLCERLLSVGHRAILEDVCEPPVSPSGHAEAQVKTVRHF